MNRVFYENGIELNALDMALEANAIIKSRPFRSFDYQGKDSRVSGVMCDCFGDGEFVLFPKDHPDVVDGQKRYMQCRKCGCISHL